MENNVARMLYDSLRNGDPLDAEWFWEAGMASAKDGTPLDIVIWDAVREIVGQFESQLGPAAGRTTSAREPQRVA
jgi:hypothetical protein